MKPAKLFGNLILILFTSTIFACSGGGDESSRLGRGTGTGTISVGLTDSSCSGYLAINVTIDEVQVKSNDNSSNGDSGWETVATPMMTYNLLELVNGVTKILGEDELVIGTYQQIRLVIGEAPDSNENINQEPHLYANYVVLDDGSYGYLKIPSDYQTGVKLDHSFVVKEGSFIELILDFEACKSVVVTGSGKYFLKPTIKVIETLDAIDVLGGVGGDNSDQIGINRSANVRSGPNIGALVSAQISDGISASVVRSTLTSDVEGEEGQFHLLLPPGQPYNIVVYSDEKLYSPACKKITVPFDGNLEQNFTLKRSDYGTISGNVLINGIIDPDDPSVVYISFFSMLDCGYVEVTSLSMSPDANTDTFSFSVDLPLGKYDVVASSQGFYPDTEAGIELVNTRDSINVSLELYEQ